MIAQDLRFEDIAVGARAAFTKIIEVKDVDQFALLSGDHNPLHVDENYARATSFQKRVVHGMLLGAYVSQLLGMHLPGKRCLILSLNFGFHKPVFVEDTIAVQGEVMNKSESTKILEISVILRRGEDIVAKADAKVQVL